MPAQGFISDSAITKAEESGPTGNAKFIIRLNDALLSQDEIGRLQDQLELVEYLPFFMVAMVTLPGRFLLEVSELKSVVQVS